MYVDVRYMTDTDFLKLLNKKRKPDIFLFYGYYSLLNLKETINRFFSKIILSKNSVLFTGIVIKTKNAYKKNLTYNF